MQFREAFSTIEDPRIDRSKIHPLETIIFITLCSVICGSETWDDIASYARHKEEWLSKYVDLSNGVPSHDTLNRVFSLLDGGALEKSFVAWIKQIAKISEGEVVSIDGKTLRGSKPSNSKYFVHMVSAWANQNGLLLGQVKVDEKSNEITAIPKLFEFLELSGCIVTIDAMGCQEDIARDIIEKKADYILSARDNQPTLMEGIHDTARFCTPDDTDEQTDKGHGRIETRICSTYSDLSHIENLSKWTGIKQIVRIESTRWIQATNQTQKETRWYITSLDSSAQKLNQAIRSHWGIENKLHWILDVAFNEDQSKKKAGNAAQNFSIINRIALMLLKRENSRKRSIKGKRKDAGWDDEYLLKILSS